MRLAQGDVGAAAAAIRDALERRLRVPSKERPPNTDLQRAPLLEAQVEIGIAVGDIDRARSAANELELVAARFESTALVASAALARGRVRLAEGDAAGAEPSLSEAVRLWNEVGAPYEAAIARLCLAEAHRASGSEHRAVLERQAARTILDGIEAAPSVAPPAPVEHHDALDEQPAGSLNMFCREGDYWMVIFGGTPSACATSRACDTWRGSSPTRAGSTTCWTSSPPRPGAPRRPTADASPRSKTTSSKRVPLGTGSGRRRPTPNAASSFASSLARLA